MKKILSIFLLLVILVGCNQNAKERYTQSFYDSFDTVITYLEYSDSESEFNENFNLLKNEYTRLHKLYDNYRVYDGVNNVMTINRNAGMNPVEVDEDLFNLIEFSIDSYYKTNGKVNIAMGSVLSLWHDAREHNSGLDESETIIPSINELEQANEHTNIEAIELDASNLTVYINDPDVQIDLGATAKGYATELIARKLEDNGVENASINAGGNVRTIGSPGDNRDEWGIALQNPDLGSSEYLEVLYISGSESVVTSGDYQRFFMHDGKRYHHLIDPQTLQPALLYRAVSVITKDSAIADTLSTALYLSTKDEAQEIISNYEEEIGILWATDDEKTNTSNIDSIMESNRN